VQSFQNNAKASVKLCKLDLNLHIKSIRLDTFTITKHCRHKAVEATGHSTLEGERSL
jgi:hypothetical protein